MSIDLICMWHERAKPQPTDRDFDVQLGCHFEEIVEQLQVLDLGDHQDTLMRARSALGYLATCLKEGRARAYITDRKEFLDSCADQIVTSTGVAYRAQMKITEAVYRVNLSNWSKYVDGKPVFNEHGKIAKGPNYQPVDLTGLY